MNIYPNKKTVTRYAAINVTALAFILIAGIIIVVIAAIFSRGYSTCDEMNNMFVNTLGTSFFLKYN